MKPAEVFLREKASGKLTGMSRSDIELIVEIMDQYADHKNLTPGEVAEAIRMAADPKDAITKVYEIYHSK